ncbi:MAG: aminotransferase class V-fold PLP-dependent enzyme [Bacteroidota bacterium]
MSIKHQFPLLDTCTYLNTASSGLISEKQVEWRKNHDLDFFSRGSGFRINQATFLQKIKSNLSGFFGAKVENTFLVPNFSFGFNTFLEGLPSGQRFLLLKEDYPSVNYAIEIRGHSCYYLTMDDELEEKLVEKIRESKPTILAFSIVQYISGIKLSPKFIKELKLQFPDLLLVADGTQFCGTEAFDFEASGFDVLISSGYKWMLSGYGNGFVFLKDEVANLLFKEARNRPAPIEAMLHGKSTLAIHFEPGHLDTLAFGTLNESLDYFKKLGITFIEDQIGNLAITAKKEFSDRGLLTDIVAGRTEHSSIFNLNLDKLRYEKLLSEKVICLQRGPGVRVAFHFYNKIDDLQKILAVLDNFTL